MYMELSSGLSDRSNPGIENGITEGTEMHPMQYAKAIVGAVLAGLGALATGLSDNVMTPVEWVMVASATIAAGGVVFGVANRDPVAIEDGPNHRAEF